MDAIEIIKEINDLKIHLYDLDDTLETLEYPESIKTHLAYVKHLIDDVRAEGLEKLEDLSTEESKDPEGLETTNTIFDKHISYKDYINYENIHTPTEMRSITPKKEINKV